MPTEVILPKVDMDMATGQISRWFYKEGDVIKKGEPLFEIETDKAAMEVDAPASGILRGVTGAEGVDIPVGSPVAWIYAEGEAVEDDASRAGGASKPAVVGPDPDVEVDAKAPTSAETAALVAPGEGVSGDKTPAASTGTDRRGVRATPLARRLARARGIELSGLSGRGPLGRIQREDVEAAAAAKAAPASAAAAVPTTGACRRLEPKEVVAPSAPAHETAPAPAPAGEGGPLHLSTLRDGTGTPIVLLHGFGSESASWRPLLAELGEGLGPILGLDLPGHGGSLGAEAKDFAGLVAGVEEALLAAGLSAVHLVGHSLGGAVALAVAAGGSADVRSLMLLSPAGFGPDIDTGFTEGFARATEEAPIRSWLRHLVADPASLSDGFVRATARGRADGRHAAAQTRLAAGLFSNGAQHFGVRERLGDLVIPVKIVAGAEDRVVPARHFAGLPGLVALHLFQGTGHLPQIERRAEVARLLRQLVR